MPSVILARDKPGILVASYPYDPSINAVMRDLPGRVFVPERRAWTFPQTPENVLQLYDRLKTLGWGLIIPPDVRAELRAKALALEGAANAKRVGDSDIAFDYLTEPYAHQRAGLEFLVRLGSGALLWEMGLGKTKTAIDYCEYLVREATTAALQPHGLDSSHLFRVLVVCPNTVARNWADEIAKHAGHADIARLTGTSIADRITRLGSARYSIVNCEALSIKAFAEACREVAWDVVIVDESTRFKTPKAARTKALHRIPTKRRLILTGTPITGKPEDAWSQFEFVDPGLFGKSYWAFAERYLAKDWFGNVTGIKPGVADELKSRIDSRSYRILKADVLDLPPKVYTDRRVVLATEQQRAYAQMRDELRVEIENTPRLTVNNILTMLLRLTQITAGLIGSSTEGYRWLGDDSAKARELDALVREELAGEQVVIFGLYQRELEELARRYTDVLTAPGHVLPIIYGPTPERIRHELIEQFQAGDRRLLFAQTRTGGIGINLTAAQTAVYHTRGWSLEEYLQSQDRLHRIGQTGTVTIAHLVAEGTIDEDIAKTLIEKQQLADHLTGDDARKLAAQVLER